MDLLELERVEVVGERIVGGVLKIYELSVTACECVLIQGGGAVPESECTAIFCVADIVTRFYGRKVSKLRWLSRERRPACVMLLL